MPGSFRFLDDIALADMAFDAEGESLPALFEAATQALIESLADPVTIAETWRHSVDMEEADIETLLFEWLGRLVYLKDAQGVVFHRATLSLNQNEGPHSLAPPCRTDRCTGRSRDTGPALRRQRRHQTSVCGHTRGDELEGQGGAGRMKHPFAQNHLHSIQGCSKRIAN
jgi:hypothetical protein